MGFRCSQTWLCSDCANNVTTHTSICLVIFLLSLLESSRLKSPPFLLRHYSNAFNSTVHHISLHIPSFPHSSALTLLFPFTHTTCLVPYSNPPNHKPKLTLTNTPPLQRNPIRSTLSPAQLIPFPSQRLSCLLFSPLLYLTLSPPCTPPPFISTNST